MNKTYAVLIGLALAGSALTVNAQPGPGRGSGGPHRFGAQGLPRPIAAALDVDGDGVLSAAEIAQAATNLLKLDKNGDGQLTADEFCVGGQQGQGARHGYGGGRPARDGVGQGTSAVCGLFDTDKDGVISAAEIGQAPAVLSALDRNQDGQVTADEIRPMRGGGGRGQGSDRHQRN